MSQERQTERFLGGGLNLLAPGDLMSASDAMESLNWRCDQVGQLRSRRREIPLAGTVYATPIHSQFYQNTATPWRYTGGADKLYRNEVEIAAGFDGSHLGLANWDTYLWVMNRAKQGRLSFNDFVFRPWLPDPPATPPTVAASATPGDQDGTYSYYLSFDTNDGYESDLSPISADVTVSARGVDLSAIALSIDPAVTMRHIYRDGGYQDELYRVGTLADNTTTVFTDTMGDIDAGYAGISHTADHHPPPPARGMASTLYHDKLIAFSSADNPNWFWWTPADKPWYWPGSNLSEGNHAPVGQDGEEILGVSVKPRMVIFYNDHSIWRMVGDPDDASGDLEIIHPTLGILGPAAWASDGAVDYIGSPEGVYRVNGDAAVKVSPKLDPLFKGESIELGAYGLAPMALDPAARAQTVLAVRNSRLYVSYAEAGRAAPSATVVMNLDTGEWYRDDRAFTALCAEGKGDFVGAIGNKLYSVEDGGTQAMSLAYQSRFTDQGAPENLKMYADLVIEHDTGGAALQVNALYDRGTAVAELGVIQSDGWASTVLPIDGTGHEARNFAVGVYGTAGAKDVFLFSAHLHYYVTARLARTYDSQVQDLGPKLRPLAKIAFDIQNPDGAVDWAFYCDDGGVLAKVESGTLATAADRQKIERAFGRIHSGRLVRVVLTALRPFRVYGVALCEFPYVDLGAKVHQFAKVAFDIEAAAPAPWKLLTDGAGDLRLADAGTIPAGGRQRVEFPLAHIYQGRLAGISVLGDYRLYAMSVWARPLGLFLPKGTTITLPPVDLGSRRLKLLKEIALSLDGSIHVSAQTDAPGTAFAERAAGDLSHRAAGWAKLTLPQRTRGRNLGLTLTATADTLVYAGKARYKTIGEASPTSWDWAPLAIEPTPEAFGWMELPLNWIDLPVTTT